MERGPDRRYVALAEGDVHVRRDGTSGPVGVLLHDAPGTSAALAAGTGTVFTLDLPGYGGTTVPAGAVDPVAVVAQVLTRLGVGPVPVVEGAAGIAARLATEHPEVCSGAVVLGPAGAGAAGAGAPPPVPAGPSGAHLIADWWTARLAGMFRPWWSESEADRYRRSLPPASAIHAAAIDLMETPRSGGTGARNHYQPVDSGLVHLRTQAGPDGSRRRPVMVLPPAPGSAHSVHHLSSALGRTRRTVAVDYPGHGRSDPMTGRLRSLDDYVDVLEETAAGLGLGPVDVVGVHSGALLAVLWQQRYPARVASLVVDGLPTRAAFAGYDLDAHLPSMEPTADGAHVARAWAMASDRALWSPWTRPDDRHAVPAGGASVAQRTEWAVDLLRSGPSYRRLYRLVLEYDLRAIDDPPPTLLCADPGDPLSTTVAAAAHLLPVATIAGTSGHRTGADATRSAAVITAFLDRTRTGAPA